MKVFQALNRLRNKSGQVAIILILVAAMGLIFYAVSMNLGNVSETKTAVSIAANTGASLLASQMASYGQSLFKEQMGGKFKICSTTWIQIFALVLSIILAIITIGIGAQFIFIALAVVGVGLSAAALALQVAVIQPGITAMWNKLMAKTLTTQNQYSQNGLQAALFHAVSDTKMVPDIFDLDNDCMFENGDCNHDGNPDHDQVSRLAIYYNERVTKARNPPVGLAYMKDFSAAIMDFVYYNPNGYARTDSKFDDWAITDPATAADNCAAPPPGQAMYSFCNPCCVPKDVPNADFVENDPNCNSAITTSCAEPSPSCQETLQVAPNCCYQDGGCNGITAGSCYQASVSPYVLGNYPTTPPPDFKWVYDEFYQSRANNYGDQPVISFLEMMGTDDENPKYYKNQTLLSLPPFEIKAVMEAGAMPTKTVGGATSNGWNIWGNGYIQGPLIFDEAGMYNFVIRAYGSVSQGVWPNMVLRIDNKPAGNATVSSTSYTDYIFMANMTSGSHTIGAEFTNDLNQGGQDRNLYVDKITVRKMSPPSDISQVPSGKEFFTSDDATGIFPLFHYFDTWSLNLTDHTATATALSDNIAKQAAEYCYWYDKNYETKCADAAEPTAYVPRAVRNDPLTLPINPATLRYNKTPYVDGEEPAGVTGGPTITVDKIVPPVNVVAADTSCPYINTSGGYWKKGSDRFCAPGDDVPAGTTQWPYFTGCAKQSNGGKMCVEKDPADGKDIQVPCDCDEVPDATKRLWHDDALDEIVYGIRDFVKLVDQIFNGNSPEVLARTFTSWYADLAPWIEMKSAPGEFISGKKCFICDNVSDSAKNKPRYLLQEGANRMYKLLTALRNWRNQEFDNNGAWCVPTRESCADCANNESDSACTAKGCNVNAPAGERRTFDANSDGRQGTLTDVIACLNYNVEGFNFVPATSQEPYGHINPVGSNHGNDYRYAECGRTCGLHECYDLPRSLIKNYRRAEFDASSYSRPYSLVSTTPPSTTAYPYIAANDFKDGEKFKNCLNFCSSQTCQVGANGLPANRSTGGRAFDYSGATFNESRDCVKTYDQDGKEIASLLSSGSKWIDVIYRNLNMVTTPVDYNMPFFTRCLDSCSARNCTPRAPAANGTPTGVLPTEEMIPLATDAAGNVTVKITDNPVRSFDYGKKTDGTTLRPFAETTDCQAANWKPGNDWYDKIAGLMKEGNARCDLTAGNPWAKDPVTGKLIVNPNPTNILATTETGTTTDNWLFKTRHAALEAANQVAKFKVRRDFLQQVSTELDKTIDALDTSTNEIKRFLIGPSRNTTTGVVNLASELIDKRIAYNTTPPDEGLPNAVIYGWQSEVPQTRQQDTTPAKLKNRGYWHIVKVEAAVPQDCLGSCAGPDNPGGEFPKVTTFTKGFLGMTRCYELEKRTGLVKMRVTRWDEDRDPSSLKFPNGQSIWNFQNRNPDRKSVKLDPDLINTTCPWLPNPKTVTVSPPIYYGAFMLNRPGNSTSQTATCWKLANGLLANGVMEETCAQYYDHKGRVKGFGFKFVSCPNDW